MANIQLSIDLPVSKEITVQEMIEWLQQHPMTNKLVLGELQGGYLHKEHKMFYTPANGYSKDTTIIGVEMSEKKIQADLNPITASQKKIIKFIGDIIGERFDGNTYEEAYAFIGKWKSVAERNYQCYNYPNAPKRKSYSKGNDPYVTDDWAGNEHF
jgi:hypothetical protein